MRFEAALESSQLQVQQLLARAPQILRRCRLVPCFWHTICERCLTIHSQSICITSLQAGKTGVWKWDGAETGTGSWLGRKHLLPVPAHIMQLIRRKQTLLFYLNPPWPRVFALFSFVLEHHIIWILLCPILLNSYHVFTVLPGGCAWLL